MKFSVMAKVTTKNLVCLTGCGFELERKSMDYHRFYHLFINSLPFVFQFNIYFSH